MQLTGASTARSHAQRFSTISPQPVMYVPGAAARSGLKGGHSARVKRTVHWRPSARTKTITEHPLTSSAT